MGFVDVEYPLACAAALAVLDIFEEERLVERAVEIGVRVKAALDELKRRFPRVGDVRGLGAMMGLEFTDDAGSDQPTFAKRIVAEARSRGLLLMAAGAKGDIIRVLVPLVISDGDLDEALKRLTESCEAILS